VESKPQSALASLLTPGGFVLLWSTGFIVARAAAPHADLSLFLGLRFLLAAALLAAIAAALRRSWPRGWRAWAHVGIGCLMHGLYLVTGYAAIHLGLAVGIMALIGGLQPIVAAGLATLLGGRASAGLWIGLCLGFLGLSLTLAPGISMAPGAAFPIAALGLAFVGVLSLSVAAVCQERIGRGDDLVAVSALQHAGGAAVALLAAVAFGTLAWDNAPALWLSFAWATLGISLVAVGLLIALIRQDGAARASALLLLVPPFAALQGWLLFGERLSLPQIVGFILALTGVWLARKKESP